MVELVIAEETLSLANLIDGQEDMRVIAAACRADEAPELCRELAPGLALIGMAEGGEADGIEAAARIRRELPDIKVVLAAASPDECFIDAARSIGAHSFVCADVDEDHLLYAIRCAVNGQGLYPGLRDTPAQNRFTDEERVVIRLLCQGKHRGRIALDLDISGESAGALIANIMRKAGFKSVRKLYASAEADGYVLPRREGGR